MAHPSGDHQPRHPANVAALIECGTLIPARRRLSAVLAAFPAQAPAATGDDGAGVGRAAPRPGLTAGTLGVSGLTVRSPERNTRSGIMTDMDATVLLRDARMHAGLSQAALADAAGTSQSAIARYETGAAQPSLTTLERLLAACGQRLELRAVPTARLSGVNGSVVRRHRRELLEVARGYGARNVRVFGSTARGDAGPESDVDLLVDLEPGRTLLDLVALRREASALLGLKVDVATFDTLRDAVRVEAQRDAVPV